MEIALGLLAFVSLFLLDVTNILYGLVYRSSPDATFLLFSARAVLVGMVLLPPTILMGGTLPLFCRQYVVDDHKISRTIGWLYGLNTLGAAVGCVMAGFFFIPELGLTRSVLLGAMINVFCGLVVWWVSIPDIPVQPDTTIMKKETSRKGLTILSILFFFIGFAALGYEVLWTRYLALLMTNTVYTYTLTLAVILVGIVLGSVIASRFFDTSSNRAFYFGLFQILTAFMVLLLMNLGPAFWEQIEKDIWIISLLLLVPAIFSGASFPLAVRMTIETSAEAGQGAGRMAALNTLGGILGSLLMGFFGLPYLGLQACMLFLTLVSLSIGFVAWIRLSRIFSTHTRVFAVISVCLIWAVISVVQETRIPADYLAYGKTLVDFQEGFGSNLSVLKKDDVLQLEIDRLWQGESRKNHQAVAAHVPMLLHADPRDVLLVGVGAGQTPGRLLMYDVEKVTCIDIEPTIFDFIRRHFDTRWMDDRRVHLIREDGRSFVEHSSDTYDVISLEVGQVFRPGVAFFYTREFYRKIHERLNEDGIVSQFVPVPFFTKVQFQGAIRTFLNVFPNSVLWYNTSELLLLGFKTDNLRLNAGLIENLMKNQRVYQDLAYSHWGGVNHRLNQPHMFLSGFLMGPQGLRQMVDAGPVYTDDRPVLDYATVGVEETKTADELTIQELLSIHAESTGSLIDLNSLCLDGSAIDRMQNENLKDIACNALLRQASVLDPRNDHYRLMALISRAIRWHPDNVQANRMYGKLLMLQNKYQQAIQYVGRTLNFDPEDGAAQHDMANCYHHLGRLDKAIQYYRTAARLQPLNAELHNNLGTVLAKMGDIHQAEQYFEKALRLQPGFDLARSNLAQARTMLSSSD
jgi:spermidine synthase